MVTAESDVIPWGAPPQPRFVPACTHLRAKTQYYRRADMEQPAGWIAESETLGYWCGRTHDYVGPDQRGCDPRRCQAGRRCYAAPPLAV